MKKYLFPLLLVVALSLVSCKTPAQKKGWAQVGVAAGNVLVPLVAQGVNITTQIIVARAQSSEDLSKKGDFLSSAASQLRGLEGSTAGIVTPAMVQQTILGATDATKTHWNDYATAMAQQFASSSASADVKLESLAVAADNTAATAKAKSAAPTLAPSTTQPVPTATPSAFYRLKAPTPRAFDPDDALDLKRGEAQLARMETLKQEGLFLAFIDKHNPLLLFCRR